MNETLQASFEAQLERDPARRAVGFLAPTGVVTWHTWEELHARAAAQALGLRQLGVQPKDVVILALPSNEACAILLLAVLLCGAVPLLVAPPVLQGMHSNLAAVLARMVVKLAPKLVLCPSRMVEQRQELESRRRQTRFLFGAEAVPALSGNLAPPRLDAHAVVALQLTSGTTGFPRVCQWRQQPVLAALAGMRAAMRLAADDLCFNWTPLYHDMGLVNNFFLCLASGVPLVMAGPQDFVKRPALWLRGMAETGATLSWSPNFGFALAVRKITPADMDGVRLERVRALWNAAERIHLETMQSFHSRFAPYGLRWEAMQTNFGCAECVGGVAFSSLEAPLRWEHLDGEALQSRHQAVALEAAARNTVTVVGVGRAAPGVDLRILSRLGKPLADGQVGEIAVHTPSRMQGYVGDRKETRRALHGKLLRTGDLGYKRGDELFWVGRVRERITVQGRKVDPSYFETALAQVAGLRPGCFVAFGIDDARRGTQRVVVAAEVGQPSVRPFAEIAAEIRDRIFHHLGLEVSETLLVARGTLAKTSSGKRRHQHFRRLYLEGKLRSLEPQQGVYDASPVHPAADEPTRLGR
ncbi:MAG TPA: AMP-binding protein [Candidatus Krumholzibacteria bacterium]|nr:AMP-binding protein [Candidatus Krumholzibacteria bacterium]